MTKATTKKTTKPAPKPVMIKIDKQVVTDLASCTLFALTHLSPKRGSGMRFNSKTREVTVWQEDFMKALDGVGHCIDRDDFWKTQGEQSKKRSRR